MKRKIKLNCVFAGGMGAALILLFGISCTPSVNNAKVTDITKKPEPKVADLTLMVYMAADNDLESYALENLRSMHKAVFKGINVLVLLDRAQSYDETEGDWTDTRLYELSSAGANSNAGIFSKQLDCPSLGLYCGTQTELDMANYSVLKGFIEFVKAQYLAKHYALIVWGHGTGWRYIQDQSSTRAVAIDDKTQSYMSVHNLGLAVKDQGLSVIGFDTCFGGVLENVYELKASACFTVGSAGITPSLGWDYKKLLEKLGECNYQRGATEDNEVAREIALCMSGACTVGATVFENTKLDLLMKSFEDFACELAAEIKDSDSQKAVFDTLVTTKAYSYIYYPCDMYLDLFTMAQQYSDSGNSALEQASKELMQLTQDLQIGVHFIPKLSNSTTAVTHSPSYVKDSAQTDQCAFIKESRWWVPTVSGNSGSVLDKLFYTVF